jgi:hypothetical protein
MNYHYISIREAKIKKTNKTNCWGSIECSYIASMSVKCTSIQENNLTVSYKSKPTFAIW